MPMNMQRKMAAVPSSPWAKTSSAGSSPWAQRRSTVIGRLICSRTLDRWVEKVMMNMIFISSDG